MNVNSYVIRGPEGAVVVDGQLCRDDGERVRQAVAAIGLPLAAATPLCVVHGRTDDYCSPAGAQALYDRARGPKDLLWLDTTNHIDLYDVPDYVEPTVRHCADWLTGYLAVAPA